MTSAEIIAILEAKFGGRIKAKKVDALDPYIVIEPGDLLEVCSFLNCNDFRRCHQLLVIDRWWLSSTTSPPHHPTTSQALAGVASSLFFIAKAFAFSISATSGGSST